MSKEAESVGAADFQVDLLGGPDFCGCVRKAQLHVYSMHVQSMAEKRDGRGEHARAQQIPQGHHVSHNKIMCAVETLAWGILVAAHLKQDPQTWSFKRLEQGPLTCQGS
jgi:hypothetical protein